MADRRSTSNRPLAKPSYNTLVASAAVVTARSTDKPIEAPGLLPWQAAAWEFFDTVGEYRMGINWQANGLSRCNLVAAIPPQQVGDEPTPITDLDDPELTPAQRRCAEFVRFIAGGPAGQGAMLYSFGKIVGVGGFAWLIAEPSRDNPQSDVLESWNVYSQDVVKAKPVAGGTEALHIAQGDPSKEASWRPVHPKALIVKVWRPDARKPWEPDAQTKGVLAVLELLDLLTAHITASARSRLAGAGMVIFPSEMEFPQIPYEDDAGDPLSDQARFDAFIDQWMDTMLVPIRDRDNSSAVVPYPVQMPADLADKVKHLTFSTPFDDRVLALKEMTIKRLSIGLDMPPEVLTGMAGVNHWTAWQVEETAVTMHIEPAAEMICQALTEGYLKRAMRAESIPEDTAIVWYDTSDLTTPPDRSANAEAAYDRLEASGEAFRRLSGLEGDDAPDEAEVAKRVWLTIAQSGSGAMQTKALERLKLISPEEAADLKAKVEEEAAQPFGGGPSSVDEPDRTPPREDRPQGADLQAVVAACDIIMHRAMERAGARLRTEIGRKSGDSPASDVEYAKLHTVYDPTLFADLDMLLEGAWTRVPATAEFLGLDPQALTATLNSYARALLASQHEHDLIRLMGALGADAIA